METKSLDSAIVAGALSSAAAARIAATGVDVGASSTAADAFAPSRSSGSDSDSDSSVASGDGFGDKSPDSYSLRQPIDAAKRDGVDGALVAVVAELDVILETERGTRRIEHHTLGGVKQAVLSSDVEARLYPMVRVISAIEKLRVSVADEKDEQKRKAAVVLCDAAIAAYRRFCTHTYTARLRLFCQQRDLEVYGRIHQSRLSGGVAVSSLRAARSYATLTIPGDDDLNLVATLYWDLSTAAKPAWIPRLYLEEGDLDIVMAKDLPEEKGKTGYITSSIAWAAMRVLRDSCPHLRVSFQHPRSSWRAPSGGKFARLTDDTLDVVQLLYNAPAETDNSPAAHQYADHWGCLVRLAGQAKPVFYDSIKGHFNHALVATACSELFGSVEFDVGDAPAQADNKSCGVFAIAFAVDALLRDGNVAAKPVYTNEHEMREHLAHCLLTGTFDPFPREGEYAASQDDLFLYHTVSDDFFYMADIHGYVKHTRLQLEQKYNTAVQKWTDTQTKEQGEDPSDVWSSGVEGGLVSYWVFLCCMSDDSEGDWTKDESPVFMADLETERDRVGAIVWRYIIAFGISSFLTSEDDEQSERVLAVVLNLASSRCTTDEQRDMIAQTLRSGVKQYGSGNLLDDFGGSLGSVRELKITGMSVDRLTHASAHEVTQWAAKIANEACDACDDVLKLLACGWTDRNAHKGTPFIASAAPHFIDFTLGCDWGDTEGQQLWVTMCSLFEAYRHHRACVEVARIQLIASGWVQQVDHDVYDICPGSELGLRGLDRYMLVDNSDYAPQITALVCAWLCAIAADKDAATKDLVRVFSVITTADPGGPARSFTAEDIKRMIPNVVRAQSPDVVDGITSQCLAAIETPGALEVEGRPMGRSYLIYLSKRARDATKSKDGLKPTASKLLFLAREWTARARLVANRWIRFKAVKECGNTFVPKEKRWKYLPVKYATKPAHEKLDVRDVALPDDYVLRELLDTLEVFTWRTTMWRLYSALVTAEQMCGEDGLPGNEGRKYTRQLLRTSDIAEETITDTLSSVRRQYLDVLSAELADSLEKAFDDAKEMATELLDKREEVEDEEAEAEDAESEEHTDTDSSSSESESESDTADVDTEAKAKDKAALAEALKEKKRDNKARADLLESLDKVLLNDTYDIKYARVRDILPTLASGAGDLKAKENAVRAALAVFAGGAFEWHKAHFADVHNAIVAIRQSIDGMSDRVTKKSLDEALAEMMRRTTRVRYSMNMRDVVDIIDDTDIRPIASPAANTDATSQDIAHIRAIADPSRWVESKAGVALAVFADKKWRSATYSVVDEALRSMWDQINRLDANKRAMLLFVIRESLVATLPMRMAMAIRDAPADKGTIGMLRSALVHQQQMAKRMVDSRQDLLCRYVVRNAAAFEFNQYRDTSVVQQESHLVSCASWVEGAMARPEASMAVPAFYDGGRVFVNWIMGATLSAWAGCDTNVVVEFDEGFGEKYTHTSKDNLKGDVAVVAIFELNEPRDGKMQLTAHVLDVVCRREPKECRSVAQGALIRVDDPPLAVAFSGPTLAYAAAWLINSADNGVKMAIHPGCRAVVFKGGSNVPAARPSAPDASAHVYDAYLAACGIDRSRDIDADCMHELHTFKGVVIEWHNRISAKVNDEKLSMTLAFTPRGSTATPVCIPNSELGGVVEQVVVFPSCAIIRVKQPSGQQTHLYVHPSGHRIALAHAEAGEGVYAYEVPTESLLDAQNRAYSTNARHFCANVYDVRSGQCQSISPFHSIADNRKPFAQGMRLARLIPEKQSAFSIASPTVVDNLAITLDDIGFHAAVTEHKSVGGDGDGANIIPGASLLVALYVNWSALPREYESDNPVPNLERAVYSKVAWFAECLLDVMKLVYPTSGSDNPFPVRGVAFWAPSCDSASNWLRYRSIPRADTFVEHRRSKAKKGYARPVLVGLATISEMDIAHCDRVKSRWAAVLSSEKISEIADLCRLAQLVYLKPSDPGSKLTNLISPGTANKCVLHRLGPLLVDPTSDMKRTPEQRDNAKYDYEASVREMKNMIWQRQEVDKDGRVSWTDTKRSPPVTDVKQAWWGVPVYPYDFGSMSSVITKLDKRKVPDRAPARDLQTQPMIIRLGMPAGAQWLPVYQVGMHIRIFINFLSLPESCVGETDAGLSKFTSIPFQQRLNTVEAFMQPHFTGHSDDDYPKYKPPAFTFENKSRAPAVPRIDLIGDAPAKGKRVLPGWIGRGVKPKARGAPKAEAKAPAKPRAKAKAKAKGKAKPAADEKADEEEPVARKTQEENKARFAEELKAAQVRNGIQAQEAAAVEKATAARLKLQKEEEEKKAAAEAIATRLRLQKEEEEQKARTAAALASADKKAKSDLRLSEVIVLDDDKEAKDDEDGKAKHKAADHENDASMSNDAKEAKLIDAYTSGVLHLRAVYAGKWRKSVLPEPGHTPRHIDALLRDMAGIADRGTPRLVPKALNAVKEFFRDNKQTLLMEQYALTATATAWELRAPFPYRAWYAILLCLLFKSCSYVFSDRATLMRSLLNHTTLEWLEADYSPILQRARGYMAHTSETWTQNILEFKSASWPLLEVIRRLQSAARCVWFSSDGSLTCEATGHLIGAKDDSLGAFTRLRAVLFGNDSAVNAPHLGAYCFYPDMLGLVNQRRGKMAAVFESRPSATINCNFRSLFVTPRILIEWIHAIAEQQSTRGDAPWEWLHQHCGIVLGIDAFEYRRLFVIDKTITEDVEQILTTTIQEVTDFNNGDKLSLFEARGVANGGKGPTKSMFLIREAMWGCMAQLGWVYLPSWVSLATSHVLPMSYAMLCAAPQLPNNARSSYQPTKGQKISPEYGDFATFPALSKKEATAMSTTPVNGALRSTRSLRGAAQPQVSIVQRLIREFVKTAVAQQLFFDGGVDCESAISPKYCRGQVHPAQIFEAVRIDYQRQAEARSERTTMPHIRIFLQLSFRLQFLLRAHHVQIRSVLFNGQKEGATGLSADRNVFHPCAMNTTERAQFIDSGKGNLPRWFMNNEMLRVPGSTYVSMLDRITNEPTSAGSAMWVRICNLIDSCITDDILATLRLPWRAFIDTQLFKGWGKEALVGLRPADFDKIDDDFADD